MGEAMASRPSSRPEPPAEAPIDDPLDSAADHTADDAAEEARAAREREREREVDVRIPLERILPELIRKGFEVGRGPLEKVSESLFPKDIAGQLASHIGDVRSGIVKAVAQEVGRFLREADIASEVRKVLTGIDVEAQVRFRFSAREDGARGPQLKVEVDTGDKRGKK
jgi:hypothetical protein